MGQFLSTGSKGLGNLPWPYGLKAVEYLIFSV
jgi:hypothetical protein